MAVNLHEICRLCLEEIKTPSTKLTEGSSLLTKIRRFLHTVKIQPGDGLPTLVCEECESLVNICYNFKLQVERSDLALQKYCASHHERLPLTQPFIIRKDDVSAADTSAMDVSESSYEDSIECAVGIHLLAPLGISNLPSDNKHTETDSTILLKSQQEHSTSNLEKDYDDRGNLSLPSNIQVHSCGCVKDCKSHHFLDVHRSKPHLKEKPYMCVYCGQSFPYMSSLTRHLVVHSREKRYVCHTCNKAFTQEAHLKSHSILHTDGDSTFLQNVFIHLPDCMLSYEIGDRTMDLPCQPQV